MKRISFILTALMLLSFGLANGQNHVSLDAVSPYIGVDQKIPVPAANVAFTWRWQWQTDPGDGLGGFSIAYDVYSADGATWTSLAGTFHGNFGPVLSDFGSMGSNYFINNFSVNGAGNDTVSFAGFDGPAPYGTFESFNNLATVLTTGAVAGSEAGKHICVDSVTAYGVGGDWSFGGGITFGIYTPDFGTGPFASHYTAGQGYCFELYIPPNLNPAFSGGTCVDFGGDHCAILQHQFQAQDPDNNLPLTFSIVSGPGTINANTGAWSYQPTCADVAASPIALTVRVTDALGGFADCAVDVSVTNVAPAITSGCGTVTAIGKGLSGNTDLNAAANDCDPVVWSLGSISPAPVGTISIDGNGTVTFNTDDPGDGGILYTVEVIASDCAGAADTCTVQFDVLILTPFSVKIEKTHNTIQGQHEYVDVTLEQGSQPLGGFDFLISYDASALQFVSAIPGGDLYDQAPDGCGWEYFTYRYSAFGNCGNACASGKVRVTGIAETNNGPNHPDCFLPGTLPATMFTLDFLVSDNRTFECMYAPVRFVWFDCGDNTISNPLGDTLYISRNVFDFDLIGNIADSTGTYPTWNGAQLCDNPNPDKPDPVRFIDFYNGGVDIVCADSIDARGDINLNEIANEIADAVLYSNYFVYGLGVFNVNLQGQIAASDVNADGIALSVADLVYLIRVVIGDANPFPKVAPASIEATYTVAAGEISIDATVAAAAIVVEGNVTPTLLANNMNMISNFDGTNTRILVYTNVDRNSIETFSGNFLAVNGNVISAEFATAEGGVVNAAGKLVANKFVLNQNYPNPFNPKTRISFNLPSASQYSLTIYNITGQKVKEVSGTGVAGINELDWDATNEASGIYFYKLTAGTFSETKKMVFLK